MTIREQNTIKLENLNSLKKWNPQQNDALLQLLLELLTHYRVRVYYIILLLFFFHQVKSNYGVDELQIVC